MTGTGVYLAMYCTAPLNLPWRSRRVSSICSNWTLPPCLSLHSRLDRLCRQTSSGSESLTDECVAIRFHGGRLTNMQCTPSVGCSIWPVYNVHPYFYINILVKKAHYSRSFTVFTESWHLLWMKRFLLLFVLFSSSSIYVDVRVLCYFKCNVFEWRPAIALYQQTITAV